MKLRIPMPMAIALILFFCCFQSFGAPCGDKIVEFNAVLENGGGVFRGFKPITVEIFAAESAPKNIKYFCAFSKLPNTSESAKRWSLERIRLQSLRNGYEFFGVLDAKLIKERQGELIVKIDMSKTITRERITNHSVLSEKESMELRLVYSSVEKKWQAFHGNNRIGVVQVRYKLDSEKASLAKNAFQFGGAQ